MRFARPVYLLIAAAAAAAACGGGEEAGPGEGACEPGAQTSCACGAAAGTMVCDAAGGWGACSCAGAVAWSPQTLYFGESDNAAPRELTVTLWRDADAPTPIRSVRLVDADPSFSIVSAPAAIPAGGVAVLVVVAFQADLPVDARGTLVVDLEDTGLSIVVPLHAARVGLAFTCAAADLDFGLQTLGVPATRQVTCRNVSVLDAFGAGSVLLRLQGVSSDDPEFTGSVPEGLFGPGEEFTFDVRYLPLDAEPDRATVRLVTEQGLERTWEATGTSELATCHLEVSAPLALTGVPGEELSGVMEFRNTRDDAGCLVQRFEAAPDCDDGFSFDLPAPGTAILPGAVLPVPFRFRGEEQTSYACTLRAVADDPSGEVFGQNLVAVLSWRPCLAIEGPDELPAVSPSCGPRVVEVSLRNRCNLDFFVDGLRFTEESAPGFSVGIEAPFALPPRGVLPLPVAYDPDDANWRSSVAAVLEAASRVDPAPWRFVFRSVREVDHIDSAFDYQPTGGRLDVLAVIDNGLGMGPESARLIEALAPMPDRLFGYDFRLGVTTTGVAPDSQGQCSGPAGGGENGRLVPVDGSAPRVITPATPDAGAAWTANLQVGACHDAPAQPLVTAVRALGYLDGLVDDPATPSLPDDGNKDFFRDGAALLLLFIGDRDDASPNTPESYWSQLRWSRSAGRIDVVTIAGDPGTGCTGALGEFALAAPRLHRLSSVANGAAYSICQGPWDLLDRYDIRWALKSCFGLDGPPADWNGDGVVDSLDVEVSVAGEPVPEVGDDGLANWTWNPETNEVCFVPEERPLPGTTTTVRRLICD